MINLSDTKRPAHISAFLVLSMACLSCSSPSRGLLEAECINGAPDKPPCPDGYLCLGDYKCHKVCQNVGDCQAHEACLNGFCAAYAASCKDGASCAEGWFCDGDACRRDVTLGQLCATSTECSQGYCAEGVCCDTPCDGICESCLQENSGALSGLCEPIPAGEDPEGECGIEGRACTQPTCTGERSCDLLLADGSACTDCAQCDSGYCVDGVCCEAECEDECMSCREADTEVASGTCAPVAAGYDPDDECDYAQGCDGTGACHPGDANGTTCDAATPDTCTSMLCVDEVCCNATCEGLCEACVTTLSGAPDGVCAPIMDGIEENDECDETGSTCSGFSTCKATIGQRCTHSAECMSDYCAGSFCSEPPTITIPDVFFPWNGYVTGTLHAPKNLGHASAGTRHPVGWDRSSTSCRWMMSVRLGGFVLAAFTPQR